MTQRFAIGALATSLLLAHLPAQAAAAATPPAGKVSAAVSAQETRKFAKLADDYYQASARFQPIWATEGGDSRFDDQLGKAIFPAERAKQYARYRDFSRRLQAIDQNKLVQRDRISHDVLAFELKTLLSYEAFPTHLLPVNQMDNLPVMLANYAGGEGSQPLGTVKQHRAYLSRLKQLPGWLDQAVANLREGLRSGVTLPKAVVVSTLPQFQKLVSATPEDNIFYKAVGKIPAGASAADKASLARDYRAAIVQLQPALARIATFIEKEYLPASRTTAGLGELPNGRAWYQAFVAEYTTTDLTPDAIHDMGLKEVARIQAEFTRLGPQLGYQGAAAGLPVWISQQPRFFPYQTDAEVLDVYRKLDGVLDQKLPQLFTLVPKARLDVRLEPELSRDTASDHYTSPAIDGSRPGVFWAVVPDAPKYNRTDMTTLFLHEGKPGHHFHIALMQEQPLPDFRKFGGNTAFTEGWALYAESLGREMQLYDDPGQYFGHLNAELLRAARLVVDTGLHTRGWTREQTIKYLQENLGYDEPVARNATERYMAIPGQALGYKIGSLKIQALRQRAQGALGEKFSLPAFHEQVLGDGTMPLNLLENKIDHWIAQQRQ